MSRQLKGWVAQGLNGLVYLVFRLQQGYNTLAHGISISSPLCAARAYPPPSKNTTAYTFEPRD